MNAQTTPRLAAAADAALAGAKGSIPEAAKGLILAARKDCALLLEMVEPFLDAAALQAVRLAKRRADDAAKRRDGAPPTRRMTEAEVLREAQRFGDALHKVGAMDDKTKRRLDELTGGAGPAARPPKAEPPKAKPLVGLLNVARVVQRSLLDTFMVNGKPVGDLTGRQARRWAETRGQEALFVRLLAETVPDKEMIRMRRTDAEAARLWKIATKEAA